METEETLPISSSSSPPHDFDDDFDVPIDFSPVGSPDVTATIIPPPSDQPPLSDDLRLKIIKQVEYYFSDENLATDNFLMKFITKDRSGYVPISLIASFKKVKKLSKDTLLIATALKESSLLLVSTNGKRVKRLEPLPSTEIRDPQLCTVLVENLPEDHSEESLRRIFGEAGKVKNVSISDPHSVKDPKKCTVSEKLLSGKLHALVEYDSVEAAEKAVESLNNGHDWRFGLRVKLLKKMVKPGQRKQVWRELDPERNNNNNNNISEVVDEHLISEQHEDSHDEEKNGKDERGGGHRGQNRGRGRRQNNNRGCTSGHGHGHGHGHGNVTSSHRFEPTKPPPGPKMPDGTKGFSLGRGKPLEVTQS